MKFIPRREKYDPKWVGDFLKKGVSVFTKESFELLDAVRKKYSGEWINYLNVIRESLKGPRGVKVRPQFVEVDRRISALQDRMRNVATYIGRIIDWLETPTEQEVRGLFEEIKAIEQEFADLIRIGEENKNFQQVLENIRIHTGLDLRSLATAHRLVEGRLKALKTEKPEGFLRTAVWESPTFAQVRQMAWGLAGPAGIAARVLIGKYREWKEQQRESKMRRRWEKEAPEIERIAPYIPKEVLEAYLEEIAPVRVRGMPGGERIRRGKGMGKGRVREERMREEEPEITIGGEKIRMEDLPPDIQDFLREQMSGVRTERGRREERRRAETTRFGRGRAETIGVGAVETALYQFFDKGAYKARWTTEIIEILKGTKGAGGAGIGGILQGLMGWLKGMIPAILAFIKSIIPVILPVVLVALSALAGWIVGKFIGDKLWEWIQPGVERWAKRRAVRRQVAELKRAGARPEIARALELNAQGMPLREAIIQANKEFGKPTPEVFLKPPEERKLEPVPVPETSLVEEVREGNERISQGIEKLVEAYEKKTTVTIPESKERVSDTRNVGDPFLEDLDKGDF